MTVMIEKGVILRVESKYFHFTDLGCSLYLRMERMRFLLRSGTEVHPPRAITSPSILANHSSTWLSHDTVMCEMSPPSSAASLRVDQCVEPSAGVLFVLRGNTPPPNPSVT